jgi:hypothetical protein
MAFQNLLYYIHQSTMNPMDITEKIRLMRKTSAFLTDIWGADKVYKSLVCGLRVRI